MARHATSWRAHGAAEGEEGACEPAGRDLDPAAQDAVGVAIAAGVVNNVSLGGGEEGGKSFWRDGSLDVDLDLENAIARANASHNEHIARWRDCLLSPPPPVRSGSSLSAAPTRRCSTSSLKSLCSSPCADESTPKKSVRWSLLGLPIRERLPRAPLSEKLAPPRSLRSRSSDEVRTCYLARLGLHPPAGPRPAVLSAAPLNIAAPGLQGTSMAFLGGWCM